MTVRLALGFSLAVRHRMLWVRMPSEFYFPRFCVDIVLIAADVIFQTALSFENNALGNYIVEEHTVVRDEEDRAW
ncbi:hypothetical protein ACFFKZ_12320 [Neisseria gonorrhoeae]